MTDTNASTNDPTAEQPGAGKSAESFSAAAPSPTPPKRAATAANPVAPKPSGAQPAGQRKIRPGDLVLGGVLLASDAVGAWIEEQAPTESDTLAGQAETPSVLLSQAQWEATFGPADKSRARYAAIGLATTTQSRVSRTGKALIQAGDEATLFALKPLRRSRVLSPLRKGFNHLAEIGETRIDRWAAIGRAREERSRVMTKATLNQIVTDSVTLLSDEPHVQVIVQEIVTSQSLGMTEEVIEEVRERAVTLDIRLEKMVRKTLRRPPRESLPGPNFTLQIGAGQREAERLAGKSSLAGQYAGFASRLMALAIDLLIIIVGFSVAGTLITAVRSIFHIGPFLAGIFGVAPASTWDSALAGIVVSLLAAAYFIVSWSLTGESVGKAIMGIRVVGPNGDYPTLWQSIRRYIGYLLIALSLGIGFLWVLFDKRRQGWDDKLAGTFVVYDWQARPDETFLTEAGKNA